jgi:hypothetical protein
MRRTQNDGRRAADPKVERPLDKEEVHDLMYYLLRCSLVIGEARQVLRPEHFRKEPHLKLLLDVLYGVLEAHPDRYRDNLVNFATLYNSVRKRILMDIDVLQQKHSDWLMNRPPYVPRARAGVIYRAYHEVALEDLHPQDGLELLRRFLREREVMHGIERMVDVVTSGGVIANYAEFADELREKHERIEAISESPIFGMRPPAGALRAIEIRRTGVPFIDIPLNGGLAPPEIIGFNAPTGSGKSTFCYQIAVSVAKLYPDDLVVHCSYEDNQDRMLRRAWACAGMIHKASLDKVTDPEDAVRLGLLSSTTRGVKLKPYELQEAVQGGKKLAGTLRGEYERLMAVWAGYDNYSMVDLVGDDRGSGYVDEIATIVEKSLREKPQYKRVSLVIVDSIDIVVENYLAAQNLDPAKNMTYALRGVARLLRRKVSTRFDTPVLITNQIAGAQLKKSATQRMSHSDAGLSKDWAQGLDFCLNLGNTEKKKASDAEDDKDACAVGLLSCSKARRAGTGGWARLIRLKGDFGYWEDCSNDFTIQQGQIVPVRDVALTSAGPLARRTSSSNFGDIPLRIT